MLYLSVCRSNIYVSEPDPKGKGSFFFGLWEILYLSLYLKAHVIVTVNFQTKKKKQKNGQEKLRKQISWMRELGSIRSTESCGFLYQSPTPMAQQLLLLFWF